MFLINCKSYRYLKLYFDHVRLFFNSYFTFSLVYQVITRKCKNLSWCSDTLVIFYHKINLGQSVTCPWSCDCLQLLSRSWDSTAWCCCNIVYSLLPASLGDKMQHPRCRFKRDSASLGGQRGKTRPCGYLIRARSGWGLFPLLRSHRDEEAESRGEMDEQDEEVELRLGWGVGRLFLLLRPWQGKGGVGFRRCVFQTQTRGGQTLLQVSHQEKKDKSNLNKTQSECWKVTLMVTIRTQIQSGPKLKQILR